MKEILISKRNLRKIRRCAAHSTPLESCGILAGVDDHIARVFPVPNALASATEFQMEPLKQLEVLEKIDALGIEMVGYFHSHPFGPGKPSETDCRMSFFPKNISLIAFYNSGFWKINAFLMSMHSYEPLEIREV